MWHMTHDLHLFLRLGEFADYSAVYVGGSFAVTELVRKNYVLDLHFAAEVVSVAALNAADAVAAVVVVV